MTTAAELSKILSLSPFQLEMQTTRIPCRSDCGADDWDRNASHWHIVLRRVGHGIKAPIVVEYSMGSAHKGAPNIADVLRSLHSDSRMTEGQTFESWAQDLGFDTDSRRAETMFRECVKLNSEMRSMFTSEELDNLDELFSDY